MIALRALAITAALYVFVAPNAHAQGSALGEWAPAGDAESFAAAHAEFWTFMPEPRALQSKVTQLTCPQALSRVQLTAARSVNVISECWYEAGARDGVWATSFASTEFPRRSLPQFYAEAERDPNLTLEPVERSTIGPCSLEIHRMRNALGFWITLRDLYTADAFHQFRSVAYDEAQRATVEGAAQELLDISRTNKCGGIA